jgi:hypothetical protein
MFLANSSWLLGFELFIVNLLREAKCGSMGLSHEALVGGEDQSDAMLSHIF